MPPNNHDSTLLITTFKIIPKSASSFAVWREKMNNSVAAFPGFISLEMQLSKTDPSEWTSIQRFQSPHDLENWRRSSERLQLIEEVKPYLICEIKDVTAAANESGETVTEVFVTQIEPGMERAYRAWSAKIQQIESQFPGYQGVYIQAPPSEKGGNWITILRFDTPEHLDQWLNSEERKKVLKESEWMVKEFQSHRVVSPFAGWFANFTKESGEIPSVFKQTMIVILVLFPVVMLEIKFLNPFITHLNTSLATFIDLVISVGLVTWPLVPIAIYFLKWWLSPGTKDRMKKNLSGIFLVLGLYAFEIFIFWRLIQADLF